MKTTGSSRSTTINPQAPTHVLVVPKVHVATLNDLEASHDGLTGEMVRRACGDRR
jgi:histidine triad (HIT) family protein